MILIIIYLLYVLQRTMLILKLRCVGPESRRSGPTIAGHCWGVKRNSKSLRGKDLGRGDEESMGRRAEGLDVSCCGVGSCVAGAVEGEVAII